MNVIVQKFGGASVKTSDYIKYIASLIAEEHRKKSAVIVVVSAMAHVTDNLVKRTREISSDFHCDSQLMECDTILSSGEQISAALLALALQNLGFKARSWLAWQIPLKSDSTFGEARITHVATKKIQECLNKGEIPIIAGFQCINADHRITTLGRGGTDITALAVAAAFSASRCDLYKEVAGVCTADPCIIGEAKKIDFISYTEMLELSSSGAKVLHSKAVEIAMRYKIPTKITPSFAKDSGTMLVDEVQVTKDKVITAITHSINEAIITITGIPTLQATEILLSLLLENKISTDLITQNFAEGQSSLTFTVLCSNLNDLKKLFNNCQNIVKYGNLNINQEVGRIALIGTGIKSYPEAIRDTLKILSKHKLEILLFSCSETKLTIFIRKEDTIAAMQILHRFFIK